MSYIILTHFEVDHISFQDQRPFHMAPFPYQVPMSADTLYPLPYPGGPTP